MPPPTEVSQAIDGLEAYARQACGNAATIERTASLDGLILDLHIRPASPGARAVSVVGEQWLVVQMGGRGGRWELGYSEDDLRLARHLIDAAIAGHVSERSAWGRSRVAATLADGRTVSATAIDGVLASLVPLPGWTRWGSLTVSEPYRQ